MPLQRMFGFAFCGQKPMRRGKYKGNQKNQRLQNHDDAAGGPIQKETYIGSKKTGQRANGNRGHDQA